jgi:Uma2 family endonuclease
MAVKTLLTADDLLQMSGVGRSELVKGELVTMTPSGGEHGGLTVTVGAALLNFVKPRKLGRVFGAETGIIISRDPDTVRAADAAYLSNARVAQVSDLTKFLDVAPDLVVEVVSPNDTWSEIEVKVAEYLGIGVRLVWVLNPKTRSVHVYRPSSEVRRLTENDALDSEDVLAGFLMPVKELFE